MSEDGSPSRAAGAAGSGEPLRGSVVAERYRVDRLIARGGMAAVYLAHHVTLNRPVALKILSPPPDVDDSANFEDRFRLEAETLASLDHRNIVILHDFGETDDGRFFLAMEYVDGPRLTDLLKEGPLPWERAVRLLLQVCAALTYAHRRGVVHRDLKPSNLLIRTDDHGQDVVKVVDFGLVKLTEQDQSITRAGLILGSPHCMAPEQVKGVEIDHRADIYAVGVLLFRCVTGRYPFHGGHSAATMVAHINEDVPLFHEVAPDLDAPPELEALVRRCLAKRPGDRYPDMATLTDDLAGLIGLTAEQFRTFASITHPSIQREAVPQAPSRAAPPPVLLASLGAMVMLVGVASLAVVAGVVYLVATDGSDAPVAPAPAPRIEAPPVELSAPPATAPPKADDVVIEPAPGIAPPFTLPPAPTEAPSPSGTDAPAPEPANDAPEAPSARDPRPAPPSAPAEPPPAEDPDPDTESDDAPEGYMGLPDDLF